MKTIRVGVVGVGRGRTFSGMASHVGMELVALCDTWEERLLKEGERLGVATYTDYDEFLSHDMDAVVLANFFHQHTPFAVKALSVGKHVLSECAACSTLGEGVELTRAVEKSGCIYMLAENYPYMVYNQEMRKLYKEGFVGEFKYGEGEYVHPDPAHVKSGRSPGLNHWRNWMPATYYCTHSVAPVMFITDTRPVKVNGFVVPYDYDDPTNTLSSQRSDTAGIIILRMDNDAVVKSLHGALRGHGNYTRIHGNTGLMENCRCGDHNSLRIHKPEYDATDGKAIEEVYLPEFPEYAEEAHKAGHGGGDFYTSYHFANAIRSGEQPYLDVYRAVDMSIVGILAYKSVLNDSAPLDVPDFRDEAQRKQYENDDWSPDPDRKKPGQPDSSILGDIPYTDEAVEAYRKAWADNGYTGE